MRKPAGAPGNEDVTSAGRAAFADPASFQIPDKVAVVDPGATRHLTYGELDRRASQLADRLRVYGVGPEVRVGVLMARSLDLIVACVGVHKAGGAYVPLDPNLPRSRLELLLKDAEVGILIAHRGLSDAISESREMPVIQNLTGRLTAGRSAERRSRIGAPTAATPLECLAYVLYTSGSTGAPKGVAISRRSLTSYLRAAVEEYAITPRDRVLQVSSISFDVSVEEIFPCLVVGGTLVLRTEALAGSVPEFYRRCRAWSITALFLPTAYWHELAAAVLAEPSLPPTLRVVCFGGEQVLPQRIADWRMAMKRGESAAPRLINSYGPTEATVVATVKELGLERLAGPGAAEESSIGRPLSNARVHVFDPRLRPAAAREAGELCISGGGIARGYLGRPAATAARFAPDPTSRRPGQRLYRTGDRGRRLPGGDLEFLGRLDLQVKIRGFRVEPGEIETVLARHPAVDSAAVVARSGSADQPAPRDHQLVAYVVAAPGVHERQLSRRRLRRYLGGELPRYMIPAAFVVLDRLPIDARGKLDREALSRRELTEELLEGRSTAPRGPLEEKLAAIWAEVLRLPRVGVHDNFLELGGDSILGIQISARANRQGFRLTPRDLFRHQTVARLAAMPELVAGVGHGLRSGAPPAPETGSVELTPIQRWFFSDADPPERWHFNQSMLLEVRRAVTPAMLERALSHLLEHHDALRLRFTWSRGRWYQRYADTGGDTPFWWSDLSPLRRADRARAILRATTRIQSSLDLEHGPILRVAYFDLGRQGRLFLAVHHLAVDTVSWRILLADLERALDQLRGGRRVRLPPKTASFQQWAAGLRDFARSTEVRDQLDFWLNTSRRARRLPLDLPRGLFVAARGNTRGSSTKVGLTLSRRRTHALLRRLPAVYRTRINDVLLTVLALAFARWSGHRTLLVELESHGRQQIDDTLDVSRTVGWFTTTFPVLLDLTETDDRGEALKAIKEQLRAVPGLGADYYLLKYLNDTPEVARKLRAAPQPEVTFNYFGQLDSTFAGSSIFATARERVGPRRSLRGPRGYLFEVEGYVSGERLWLHIGYSRDLHRRSTVERLARFLSQELEALIAHCLSEGAGGYTPSDFPLAGLDAGTLDRLVGADRGIEDVYPLSPMQEGMLFHTLYAPERAVYFEQSSWVLEGELDVSAFHEGWRRIIERHPILRTSFAWRGLERPLQIVRRQAELSWREHDWRQLEPETQRERLEALLAADRRLGFELSSAPLMRLILVRLGERVSRFVWSAHHVLMDGWSISVIFEELFALYGALRQDRPVELIQPLPFREYIAWLERQDVSEAETFWRRHLAGFEVPTLLPTDSGVTVPNQDTAPVAPATEFDDFVTSLPPDLTSALDAFSRLYRLTLNTLVQGAWALLLARTSGRRDVVFGATASGRPASLSRSDSVVGLLINTLPVRVSIDDSQPLLPWLRQLQKRNLELRHFEHTPLARIQGWSAVPRQLPLFETLLVFENYPVAAALEREQRRDGLVISHFLGYSETNYPLALGVLPGRELGLHASYDGTRFEALAIRRLLRHLKVLLRDYVTARAPNRPLEALALLSRSEKHQVLCEWNDAGRSPGAEDLAFEHLFWIQALRVPDAVAVVDPGRGRCVTYGRLLCDVRRLASFLGRRGVGPEVRVGLLFERSLDLIVTMLGVHEAGGCYVALEPELPVARQRLMLADSRARLLLVDSGQTGPGGDPESWPAVPGLVTIDLAAIRRKRVHRTVAGGARAARPDRTLESSAYVIYTSGTTGQPKGVEITRRSLAWYATAAIVGYGLSEIDRVLQFSPVSFDISVEEIFPCLARGATLVLRTGAMAGSTDEFFRRCRQWSITSLFLPTAFWHELAVAAGADPAAFPPSLRRVAFGGEQAAADRIAQWSRVAGRQVRLFDTYGPTETTVVATACELTGAEPANEAGGGSRIGGPIAGAVAVVVDRGLRPLPIAVPGELCLGGSGVARGYFGHPAMTATRFVPDPFAAGLAAPGGRLYLTGDLARLRRVGGFDFLGRIDDQVKVRGFRVEPGEVAAQLRRHPAVRDAAVIASSEPADTDLAGDRPARRSRLVAYVVPASAAAGEPRNEWLVEQVSYWQTLHDDLYFQTRRRRQGGDGRQAAEDFASVGWDSSYTGEPIPAEEMSEWLDLTIERILALPSFARPGRPPRVLEIGCGDGLITGRVAPQSASYLATDFSRTVLDILARRLAQSEGGPSHVRLACRRADDFEGIATGAHDAVILSSVIQYFPSIGYLRAVLENAIRAAAPGASIFVGDVRSLPLLPAFCASVELHRANVSLTVRELRRRIRRRRSQEKELVIDPAFFVALKEALPEIREIRIRPKGSRFHNELTLFRYDVIIHLEGEGASRVSLPPAAVPWLDWRREHLTMDAVRRRLEGRAPPALGLLRVPNRRTSRETRLVELVAATGGSPGGTPELETVADLRRALAAEPRAGVEPTDFLALGRELSYAVELSWQDSGADGSYHVLLTRAHAGAPALRSRPSVAFPTAPPRRPESWQEYANNPLADRSDRVLASALRDHLSHRLPDYMVPSAFVVLERLPTTPSGKVDRRALPPPETLRTELEEAFQAPRGASEKILAEIWSEVLGVEGIGARDNYFALGGDSILSIQIVGKAHQRGLKIMPRDLFRHQTVAELAARVKVAPSAVASRHIENAAATGNVPLLPIQHWFFERGLPEPWHYNWATLVRLRQPLTPVVLAAAADSVQRHHEALRLRFVASPRSEANAAEPGSGWQARPMFEPPAPVSWVDLSRLERQRSDAAVAAAAVALQPSLDLRGGPVFRLVCFDPGGDRAQRLLAMIHHLVIDGVSWAVLFEDLAHACRRLAAGRPPSLPPGTTPFAAWTRCLAIEARSPATRAELAFWSTPWRGRLLPRDAAGDNTRASEATASVSLSAENTRRLLQKVPAAYRTRAQDVLLAALVRAFEPWTGSRSLRIELEGHGREPSLIEGAADMDLSRTVGWLATTFPVALDLSEASGPGAALKSIKEQLRRLPRHGIGYGLLRYLHPATAEVAPVRALAVPEVAFDYLGSLDSPLTGSSLFEPAAEPRWSLESRRGKRSHLLEIHCGVLDSRLRMEWSYSRQLHRRETIEELARRCLGELEVLIEHCLSPEAGGLTPSDVPLAALDQRQLDSVIDAPRAIEDVYPLSPMQEGMLLHSRLAPASTVYFEQTSWALDSALDVASLRRAWQWLVDRHPVLRTAFAWRGLPRPVQMVYRRVELPWREYDWSRTAEDTGARLRELLRADRRRGFDLTRAPLMRLILIRLEDRYRLVWSSHHLLTDGWSTPVLFEELSAVYDALRLGRRPAPAAPRPYRDFIAWLADQDSRPAETFWRRRLAGFTEPTRLAEKTALPGAPEHRPVPEPEEISLRLPASASAAIEAFARSHQLTFHTLAVAAWGLLLARQHGTDDVVFGVTLAGRPPALSGSDAMVGVFINTLPARIRISERESLMSWLRWLQGHQLDVQQHQHAPLVDVQRWSEVAPPRPLFESILVVENYPLRGQRQLMELSDRESFSHTSYPLTVYAIPGERLGLAISFDPVAFDRAEVGSLLSGFRHLLTAISSRRFQRLSEVPALSAEGRHQLLVEWNDTGRSASPPSIAELARGQIERRPEAVALVSGDRSVDHLTYRQLGCLADRLAACLTARGVGPETVVALDLGASSAALPIGMLAILFAGGACLPLARRQPRRRRAWMLRDAGAALVLTGRRSDAAIPAIRLAPDGTLAGDGGGAVGGGADDGVAPGFRHQPQNPVYVVYTSGSTGRPKGVAMGHRALCQLVDWQLARPAEGRSDLAKPRRTLRFAAVGFDVLFQEVFATWCSGGTLVTMPDGVRRNPQALGRAMDRVCVERAFLPPVALRQLAAAPAGARATRPLEIVAAGEQLALTPAVRAWLRERPGSTIDNHYGPSETHVVIAQGADHAVLLPPIGRPIDGSRVFVVDAGLRPVPAGATGELVIAGAGLARGYLGRPALTAARFVPDPFDRRGGRRLYRTGDLGRWSSGMLAFLGRLDHQLKVRGYRVEPGEIEAILERHPAVRSAAVVADRAEGAASGAVRLAAHVVAKRAGDSAAPAAADLRTFLAARLPEVMVPAAWAFHDALPLLPSGKVDRRALAFSPAAARREGASPDAARGPIEEILIEIWRELLGVPAGIHDNFFSLGGHSLLVTGVASRIRDAFGVELSLSRLFDRPTVARLAAEIQGRLSDPPVGPEHGEVAMPPIVPRGESSPAPLSFAQQRLWLVHQLEAESSAYALPDAHRLDGELRVAALRACFQELIRRHEILRTTFTRGERGGEVRQVIAPALEARLPVVDLGHLPASRQPIAIRGLAARETGRPFDLARGPLLRPVLIRLAPRRHVLLINQHHIVSDGWSQGVFYRELAALYGAFAAGRPSPLPAPPLQYADFAVWQRRWLTAEALAASLSYWRRQLDGVTVLELATDRPRPAPRGGKDPPAGSVDLELPVSLVTALSRLSTGAGASLFMTLTAIFMTLLARRGGQREVTVGTPIANRGRRELESLLGFFVNLLALRARPDPGARFLDFLARVRAAALEAYGHQDLPFEQLIEKLGVERSDSPPLFQVVLSLHNAPRLPAELPGLEVRPIDPFPPSIRFDLELHLWQEDGRMRGAFDYRADLFDAATVVRLAGQLERLAAAIAGDPRRRLAELPLLGRAERHQLVTEWNDSAGWRLRQDRLRKDRPEDGCLHRLFEARAQAAPDAVAVVFEPGDGASSALSYRQLDRRVDRLARRLVADPGVGPEATVGLCLDRCVEMIVGLLAIVKAGGAYVPLDPAAPRERLAQIVRAARISVIVARRRTVGALPAADVRIVLVRARGDTGTRPGVPFPPADPERLAYVMFTSGSTGVPKGVSVKHRGVVRLVQGTNHVRLSAADRVAQASDPSFDASTFEIWGSLLAGARLVVFSRELVMAPPRMISAIRRQGVSVMILSTAVFHAVTLEDPSAWRTLRHLIFGGEAADPRRVREIHDAGPPRALINVYGPTEATVFVTWYPVREAPPEAATIPIGSAITGATVHVLDAGLRPVSAGARGELCLGGQGLARGYFGKPRLTAAAYVPNPLAAGPGRRLYRSGDLARRQARGALEFLGRLDQQVKIRGFRVEPGEIEAVLARHPAVAQAAVRVDGASGEDRRLLAFVVFQASAEVGVERLRAYLARRLPAYMMPSRLVRLDALPITSRGKVDRAALLASAASSRLAPASTFVAPRGATEEIIAGIWRRLLEARRVGRDDSFFELGGHSLLATRVVSRIRRAFDVELPLAAIFERPTVRELASEVAAAREATRLRAPIRRFGDDERVLSVGQERLWFLHRLDPESPAYNVPSALSLEGRLDVPALEAALVEIRRRHRILRVRFPSAGGAPRESSIPEAELTPALPRIDLTRLDSPDRERFARGLASAAARRPFDLARGPLSRLLLLCLGRDRHHLLCVTHHIVTDDWSQEIWSRELTTLYAAFSDRRPSSLPELSIQYSDFAAWQRRELAGKAGEAALAYWRERLAGAPPLTLPTDRPRPVVRGHRAASRDFDLGAGLTRGLERLSLDAGATLFMILLAAFVTLLHRATGQSDLVIGSPIAGRRRRRLEELIGFFVNMLALRADLSGAPSFRDLVRQIRGRALEAYAHQDLPFAKLVEALDLDRDLARNPLFQVSFALQNAPVRELELVGMRVTPLVSGAETVRFDLEAHVWEQNGRLVGSLVYPRDLFDDTTVQRMARHLVALLESATGEPETRIPDLEILPGPERHQLLAEWAHGPVAARPPRLLHQLFEARAARAGDATALVFERAGATEAWLSYRQLERRSRRLAGLLRVLGVGPEARVGVCLERGPELMIALLAVHQAGGAYLPLEPALPAERLGRLLADSRARVVLTQERWQRKLGGFQGDVVLADRRPASREPAAAARVHPDHPAYVIYTSGSTGAPKGVIVSHRAIVNHVLWMLSALPFSNSDRVLHKTPIGFDAAACEIWAPLAAGARLILARPDGHRDAGYLAAATRRFGVSVLHVVPYQLGLLLDQPDFGRCRALARVDCGGETLGPELVERFRRRLPEVELVNVYGPTEATIHAAYGHLRDADRHRAVPIGRPIRGARVHLLGRRSSLVATGGAGRMHIGGAGLARGYLERPAATAERFVPDPFVSSPGHRLYDSGDLARHLPDGRLLFLGRADRQIKLRGLRVEPGEIESALERHPAVRRAAVVPVLHAPGDLRLIAFLAGVGSGRPSSAAVRAFLRRRLPVAMIPARLVWLTELPINASGKVDRAALARMSTARRASAGHASVGRAAAGQTVAPRMPTEQMLAEIWRQVLGDVEPGAHDNFFELGGHSLLATQVASRIRRIFGVELPLRRLFEAPTLAELAAGVEAARASATGEAPPPPIPRLSSAQRAAAPLSFAQERLWFLHQLEPDSSAYNMMNAWRVEGRLEPAAVDSALRALARRHESLRVVFPGAGGQPRRATGAPQAPLPMIDLEDLEMEATGAAALAGRLALDFARRPYDLARGPLWRALVVRLGTESHVLLIGVHHIVSDGWSQGVLRRELSSLYAAAVLGRRSTLEPLPIQYVDFAAWQRGWLSGTRLRAQLAFWRRRLAGLEQLRLPTDRPRPAVQTYRAASRSLVLSRELSAAFERLASGAGASLFMTLLAAYLALLCRVTGQRDVAVGSPIAGRGAREIEGLIGFFVNMLVLRGDFADPADRELDFLTLVRRAREVALDAYARQDLPFEKLVEVLDPERDLSQNPLFQVTLALQNAGDDKLELPGLEARPLELHVASVRFDLELYAWQGERLEFELVYNQDLFDATTVARMASRFGNLLASAVRRPRRPISGLELETRARRQQMLVEWNDRPALPATRLLAHQLVERWACRAPAAVAVVSEVADGARQLTYLELNRRANRLARHLRALGAGIDRPVGIYLERTVEAIVAVLGVLKSGAAYLPVDPAHGRERLRFQLRDAGAPLLVTRQSLLVELPAGLRPEGVRIVCLDRERAAIGGRAAHDLEAGARPPATLAYVAYTSGSTGRPKGAMVSHRALAGAYRAWEASYRLPAGGRHLQMASLSFDVYTGDLMRALASGGTLVVCPSELLLAPAELAALMRRQKVDHAEFVPVVAGALARHIADSGTGEAGALAEMRLLAIGSDIWLRQEHAVLQAAAGPGTRVVNSYGVTEAAIDSSFFEDRLPASATAVPSASMPSAVTPIGRPFAGTALYVLDPWGRPVPAGTQGELHVAGVGPARGYLGRPALTASAFEPDALAGEPGLRRYRTGDLARHLADGGLELIGRVDRQLKIRGFRIEPGEVEAVLERHSGVEEAAVVAARGEHGDDRLAAFVVRRPDAEDRERAWEEERVAQWRSVYEGTYHGERRLRGGPFDVAGWIGGVTGEPIPKAEMGEWVDGIVERILSSGPDGDPPRRVLEIGCGTGLLLFRIAPHCRDYLGTDFSRSVLDSLRHTLERHPVPGVRLDARPATDFDGIEAGAFDLVVLNSVAQYFPSIRYLTRVLEGGVSAVRPGGRVFVGDVRSLGLHAAYCAAVELHRAEAETAARQLARRAWRRRLQEEELLIDGDYFLALSRELPRVRRVQILPKAGHSHNELTRFRYDVILQVGDAEPAARSGRSLADGEVERLDWPRANLTVEDLRSRLEVGAPALALTRIPNARLTAEVELARRLAGDRLGGTAGDLRESLSRLPATGVDPEDLRDLGRELGYEIELSWAHSGRAGAYDAIFWRPEVAPPAIERFQPPPAAMRPWHAYGNDPLREQAARRLVPDLRDRLRERLPTYMTPAAFTLIQALPLSTAGKVDRDALARLPVTRPAGTAASGEPPRTPTEKALAEIWRDLLGVEAVGIEDGFFELGGHSLLAVRLMAAIEQSLGVKLPLASVFTEATLERLAEAVDRRRT